MKSRALLLFAFLFTLAACGGPNGPRVRYAQASAAELAALEGHKTVWYEFQPGDAVPMNFVFMGIFEAVTSEPVKLITKRPVWIVVTKDKKTAFSFDGRRLVNGEQLAKWVMLVGTSGEEAGKVTTGLVVGRPQDLPPELR